MKEEKIMVKEVPIVSIIVLTYNSSKYVLETLESVRRQTYSNIELIISDDCSSDNTVEICENFILQYCNVDFIRRTRIITSDFNSGISANCNRGIKAASGKWLKLIAGDDILVDDAISFLSKKIDNTVNFIVGRLVPFDNKCNVEKKAKLNQSKKKECFFKMTAKEQLDTFEQDWYINAPGLMMRKSVVVDLGGFDESYPMIEDYPFFFRALSSGYKFDSIEEIVVHYRVHTGSVQRSSAYQLSFLKFFSEERIPAYKVQKKYLDYWHYYLQAKKGYAKLYDERGKIFLINLLLLLFDWKGWYLYLKLRIYRPIVSRVRGRDS